MESKAGYNLLVPESRGILYSITSTILLLAGSVILSSLSYNPVAISASASFGMLLSISGILIYYHYTSKDYEITIPHPWIFSILFPLIQITASIACYYDPMNHGAVSIIISTGVIPCFLFNSRIHFIKYFPVVVALVGLGVTVYYSNFFWLNYSLGYAVASLVLVAVSLMIPKKIGSVNQLGIVAIGNFSVNLVFVLGLMILGIYPLYNELTLVLLCTFAGLLIGAAVFFGVSSNAPEINCIGYTAVGLMQVLFDKIFFKISLFDQMFLPTLPIFIGIEILLVVSLWKKTKHSY